MTPSRYRSASDVHQFLSLKFSKYLDFILLQRTWSLTINAPADFDLLSAELWDLGTIGIQETVSTLIAYFKDAVKPETIRNAFPDLAVRIETDLAPVTLIEAPDRDPIFIGTRFVIVPVDHAQSQRLLTPDRIVLPIDAAMAFGSGRHESTQLCLQALEQLLQPDFTVVDIGCGSGILALAAEKLGAAHVLAADINEPAITIARRHFHGPLLVGSADCFATASADIVISNITGKVNDHLAPDLKRMLKPSGVLIASGFTCITEPYSFKPRLTLTLGDWLCWICEPNCIDSTSSLGDRNYHDPQWWL